MPPALTPALALDYVRELSADVRAAIALAADGARLAGPEALAAPARVLLAALGAHGHAERVESAGVVCAARSERHALIVVCGPLALPGVVAADVRAALIALAGSPLTGAPAPPATALQRACEALISAAATLPEE